ncbi:MFS transporter [Pseudoroseomonas globiformis]|uniref:MFS transporter n=1 Tax=Teichococcus globiformis TaxID=2307229 RepID=A0ABV7FYP6_9PROT
MNHKSSVSVTNNHGATSLRDTLLFGAPLLVLAMGHMLSNLLRTLPAIAADVISADIAVSPESLASLTGAYHFAFAAGQIPVGVALDRYGVRVVSLVLLSIVTVGAVLAGTVGGASGFLFAQIVLGIGCCGMLLCPMTLAAKLLTPAKFGLWSGLVQGVGNTGMLLSGSPMAWLVEQHGWRTGFLVSAALAVVIAALVLAFVPGGSSDRAAKHTTLKAEAVQVVRIGLSRPLRGVIILAFSSFAAAIAVRGLWGGPWLMGIKHLDRLEAGSALMPLTLAMVVGPMIYGMVDRRLGRRGAILAIGHVAAGTALLLVAVGGSQGFMSSTFGVPVLSAKFDTMAFFVFGAAIAVQPLLFALARAAVLPDQAGKALAAVNLSFFGGAAILQALTSPVASAFGLPAVMAFLGVVLLVAATAFGVLVRRI